MVRLQAMKEKRVIKAGELLVITSGSYSGYGIDFIARAKIDLDLDALKKQRGRAEPHAASGFMRWLNENDLIEELNHVLIDTFDDDTIDDAWPEVA